MKCYFAEKGTGDIGDELQLENGKILKKETRIHVRNYFSIFGKIKVPRTCYRIEGEKGKRSNRRRNLFADWHTGD